MALGAYDAIKELGLRLPEDISVIGHGGRSEIVNYIRPPLTTMRLPYYEMGMRAIASVLDGHRAERTLPPCHPVLRGSLARAPERRRP